MRVRGAVAEWLGRGLQSLVQRFESARRLTPRNHGPRLSARDRSVLGAPFVPCLLFFRTAGAVARAQLFRRQFVVSAPLIFLWDLLWALGEAVPHSRFVVSQKHTSSP